MLFDLLLPRPETHYLGAGKTLVASPSATFGCEPLWHLEISGKRVTDYDGEPISWNCFEHAMKWFWMAYGHPDFCTAQAALRVEAEDRLAQPGATRDRKRWAQDWAMAYMTDITPFDFDGGGRGPHKYENSLTDLHEALIGIVEALINDLIDDSDTMREARMGVREAARRLIEDGSSAADVQRACDIWQRAVGGPHITLEWQVSPGEAWRDDPKLEALL